MSQDRILVRYFLKNPVRIYHWLVGPLKIFSGFGVRVWLFGVWIFGMGFEKEIRTGPKNAIWDGELHCIITKNCETQLCSRLHSALQTEFFKNTKKFCIQQSTAYMYPSKNNEEYCRMTDFQETTQLELNVDYSSIVLITDYVFL